MVRALIDTNIAIDYLNGVVAAKKEISRYDEVVISVVTWIEVMVGTDPADLPDTSAFLDLCKLVPADLRIARRSVDIRQMYRIKLPDAIIWASAQIEGCLFVTRNTKDFPAGDPGIRHPYKI